jgi:mannose-6-phosphate isomerase-like protein (cupin superfamily)
MEYQHEMEYKMENNSVTTVAVMTQAVDGPAPTVAGPTPLPPRVLAALAAGLARSTSSWQRMLGASSEQRDALRIFVTPEYDAWLIRWPLATSVTPHDHGESAGAYTVVNGELLETRWHRGLQRGRHVGPGEVVTIRRGSVHDVTGVDATSLSVHVYSPPLTSMSYYDETGRDVIRTAPVDDEPLATADQVPLAGADDAAPVLASTLAMCAAGAP